MNLTGIRRISLTVVIGLAMVLVAATVLGIAAAPAQAADAARTAGLADKAVNQPGQPPPEQITFQPYTTLPTVLDAPQQTVDLDGDGQNEASFQALRVRVSPDDGTARGRLSLGVSKYISYEFDVDWGRVTFNDDGTPGIVYLGGEGQRTRVSKIDGFSVKQNVTWEAVVKPNPDAEGHLGWEIVSVTRFGIKKVFRFDTRGQFTTSTDRGD
jgi:hypothetical protein